MPIYCFEECVAKAAAHLSGGTGPCGVDAIMLKNWLLCHGIQSERLCDGMATWVDWLSNGLPPYAAYCAVYTVRTVTLDKTPGVQPLGIGESWMRLWSDCSHTKTKVAATNACGNTQLCASLQSGIKPTFTPSVQSGCNPLGGLRTWALRRMMEIPWLQTPCANAFALMVCLIR